MRASQYQTLMRYMRDSYSFIRVVLFALVFAFASSFVVFFVMLCALYLLLCYVISLSCWRVCLWLLLVLCFVCLFLV